MSVREMTGGADAGDVAPGEEREGGDALGSGTTGYAIGLALAVLLTVMSFALPTTGLIWAPAIPAALIVFAIAQMGVHLAFFLHITTGPDNTNNTMALAFGVLIVLLVVLGSVWIMSHLSHMNMPMGELMKHMR